MAQVEDFKKISSILSYPVTTRAEFDRVLLIDDIIEKEQGIEALKSRSPILLQYKKSALRWATLQENPSLILAAETSLFYGYAYSNMPIEAAIIGDEVFEESFKQGIADPKQYTMLLNIYNQLEAYNDVLRLLPYKDEPFYIKEYNLKDGTTYRTDLGMTYYRMGNYKQAIVYFREQIPYYEAAKNLMLSGSMLNNIGLAYFKIGDLKNARLHYKEAIETLKQVDPKTITSNFSDDYLNKFKNVVQGNIAEIDLEEGNFEKALPVFLNEISYNTGTDIINANAYFNVANAYYKKSNFELALKYLDSAYTPYAQSISSKEKIKMLNLRGKIALAKGDLETAEYYFNVNKKLNDSVNLKQFERNNEVAAAKFISQENEKELVRIKAEAKANKNLSTFLWLGIITTLAFIAFLAFFYRKSKNDNSIITNQAEVLKMSLKEKEILLKEIHHRVKNNLQVISGLLQLHSKKFTDPQLLKAIDDSKRHIHSMVLVHEMLYEQDEYAVIPMEEYLKKLTNQLLFSLAETQIQTSIAIEPIELSIEKAIPMGLMLSELVTNSNKHAFNSNEGEIFVVLRKMTEREEGYKKNTYVLIYRDNGQGLPKGFDVNVNKTMGMRLIYMLAEEMNGAVSINGNDGFNLKLVFQDI